MYLVFSCYRDAISVTFVKYVYDNIFCLQIIEYKENTRIINAAYRIRKIQE
jgi:hypothetical protein